MIFKIAINALAILGVLIAHLTMASLPAGFSFLSLAPVAVVLVLLMFGWRLALIWSLVLGLSLDLWSFGLAGSQVFALLASLALSYALLKNILTNRSLYSLTLLSSSATGLYLFILWLAGVLVGDGWRWYWWLTVWKFIAANLVLTAILFYIFSLLSKRIQPVFLRQFKKY